MFAALFFMVLLREGLPLTCYRCGAVDKKTCEEQQKKDKCYYEGRCMTVSYNLVNNDGSRTDNTPVYMKSCMKDEESCRRYCQMTKDLLLIKDCQVSCCGLDECNKKEEKIKPRVSRKTETLNNENNIKSSTILLITAILFWHLNN